MNPNTGHLMGLLDSDPVPAEYELIPQELERAAVRKLNGRMEAMVSLTSGGKLSDWAAKKRKAKLATASKRKNRK